MGLQQSASSTISDGGSHESAGESRSVAACIGKPRHRDEQTTEMINGLPMNADDRVHTKDEEQRRKAWQDMLDNAGKHDQPTPPKVRPNKWQSERAARNAPACANEVFPGFNALRKQS